MSENALWRRLTAEFIGSAFLAAVVVGSGIAAQRLSPGNTGLELLENAAATATGLFALILMVGPISGAHFNPVVSFVDAAFGGMTWRSAIAYLGAQVAGCTFGAVVANLMFSLPAVSISTQHRASGGALPLGGGGHIGAHRAHLRLGPNGTSQERPGGSRGVHRCRLLLHQFDQLRQPRHRRRPYVLQLVRRHRTLVGPILRRRRSARGRPGLRADKGSLSRCDPGRGRRCRGLPPSRAGILSTKPVVLFLCIHNAGRSLAARVLLDHYAAGRIDVRSAGSEPGQQLNPAVTALLVERGLDPGKEFPKPLTDELAQEADVIITMGCGDTCPVYPGQALHRLGTRRPGRSTHRGGTPDRRRDRPAHSSFLGRAPAQGALGRRTRHDRGGRAPIHSRVLPASFH